MRRFQPALLGGLFIGVVSSLPIVGAANSCCCLWVVVGGLLTVYLQRQSPSDQFLTSERGEAALGGLLAGVVGSVIQVLFTLLIFGGAGEAVTADAQAMFDQFPQIPAEIRDRTLRLMSSGAIIFVTAAVTLPVYAVFSMLGALLGVALFRKPPVPPAASQS